MFGIGQGELLLILLAVLILFGAKRIPEVARSLGKGLADFREAMSGFEREVKGEPPIRKEPPRELAGRAPAQSRGDGLDEAPVPGDEAPAPGDEAPAPGDEADSDGRDRVPELDSGNGGGRVTDRKPMPDEGEGIREEPDGTGRRSRSAEDGWPEDPYRRLKEKPGPGPDLQG